jgi:hypothetical protein
MISTKAEFKRGEGCSNRVTSDFNPLHCSGSCMWSHNFEYCDLDWFWYLLRENGDKSLVQWKNSFREEA